MKNMHEYLGVCARIKSQTITAAATETSDIIDMMKWAEVTAYINIGAYASGNDGSLEAKFEVSNDGSSFTSSADLGVEITTATFTGSMGDEQIAILHATQEDMRVSSTNYRYLRLSLTPSNKNLTVGAVVLGLPGDYAPGADYDIAAVAEIVS